MLTYHDKNKIIFLILLIHIFLNIELYCDSYSKVGSKKINYEIISPKGRYRVEFYDLNQFINFITTHDRYAEYSRVYDNKINSYIYESPVYDGFDCGFLSFPDELRPTIFSQCFETQILELEE
jgi:hypothetical protein